MKLIWLLTSQVCGGGAQSAAADEEIVSGLLELNLSFPSIARDPFPRLSDGLEIKDAKDLKRLWLKEGALIKIK